MANPWFRLYSEFAHDPKVQMLSETYQRRLIMLFCLRCSNGDATLQNVAATQSDVAIAFQLRISEQEWEETKAVFVEKSIIDLNNNLLNWNKRQFLSDSSTERSKRHRENKKNAEKNQCNKCNVAATPPDSDSDSDSEVLKKNIKKKKLRTHLSADFVVIDRHREYARTHRLPSPEREIEKFKNHHIGKATLWKDWDLCFFNWLRNAKKWEGEKEKTADDLDCYAAEAEMYLEDEHKKIVGLNLK